MKNSSQKSTNKNRLESRLDPESQALLDSLLVRTSLTKTSIIKNALKVYASTLKNGHIYTVRLKGSEIEDKKEEPWEKDLDETIRIAKTPWLEDDDEE